MRIANYVTVRLAFAGIAIASCRVAFADTDLNFVGLPDGQTSGGIINPGFGSNVSVSGPGITVTGAGTPNIGLTWGVTPNGANPIQWNYYDNGSFDGWSAAQLLNSYYTNTPPTTTPHTLTFTPTGDVAVQINSFQFVTWEQPAPGENEVFDYTWTVVDANNNSDVLGTGTVPEFGASTTPIDVSIDVTGAVDEPLTLELLRTAFSPDPEDGSPTGQNIGIQNLDFDQTPEPTSLGIISFGLVLLFAIRRYRFAR